MNLLDYRAAAALLLPDTFGGQRIRPARMAGAAMGPPCFAVDFDRTTGIFWDVPVRLGRGAAFWTITSPPAGTPLKHDDPNGQCPLFRTRKGRLVGEV